MWSICEPTLEHTGHAVICCFSFLFFLRSVFLVLLSRFLLNKVMNLVVVIIVSLLMLGSSGAAPLLALLQFGQGGLLLLALALFPGGLLRGQLLVGAHAQADLLALLLRARLAIIDVVVGQAERQLKERKAVGPVATQRHLDHPEHVVQRHGHAPQTLQSCMKEVN